MVDHEFLSLSRVKLKTKGKADCALPVALKKVAEKIG
jgi:hypothetical protein